MGLLIVLGLLGAAVLYGIFFLFFKLLWVLFKKQRNFWPLILAGAATLLVLGGAVWMTFSAFNRFIRPFNPIIEAARTRTEPVYGSRPYTDQRYGFSLTLHNGTVMSEWIDWNGLALLIGADTNAFLSAEDTDENRPFAVYLVTRMPRAAEGDAMEVMGRLAQQIEQAEFDGEVRLDDMFPVQTGAGSDGAILTGTLYVSSMPEGIPFSFLLAKQNDCVYYVAGFGNTPGGEVEQTVESFRLGEYGVSDSYDFSQVIPLPPAQ